MSADLLTRPTGGPDADAMDPRLRARRIEVARDRGRRRLRRMVALGILTVLTLAAIGISRSPLLDVDTVRVEGAARSGSGTVRSAAGIWRGRPMTSVDLGAAEARLEALPWVADATVARRWPGTVAITVRERTPAAVMGEGAGSVLVDREGRILGPASGREQLPVAGDDPTEGPGDLLPAASRPLVGVLADLPPELRAEVALGEAVDGGFALELHDGVRVLLGDGTRLRAKASRTMLLLAEADRSTIATVDVGVPDAPALTRRPPGGA